MITFHKKPEHQWMRLSQFNLPKRYFLKCDSFPDNIYLYCNGILVEMGPSHFVPVGNDSMPEYQKECFREIREPDIIIHEK
jgi:hypothetical protein